MALDEAALALERINRWRSVLGLQPFTRHPALDAAAQAHARYYELNYGDPSLTGMGLHRESPGKPGFTGENILDRARAHGYPGSVNENIGLTGSLVRSVDLFMATINHRLPLIDPRYQHIGFGAVNRDGIRMEVVMVGTLAPWSEQATPEWGIWPPDGTSGVGTHFWGEVPDPYPGAQYPLGYPVTAKYFGAGSVAFTGGTLLEGDRSIPVHFAAGTGWLSRRTALLAATEPLRPGTLYRYVIEGTIDGAPFRLTGQFRTARTADEELSFQAPAPPAALPPGLATAPEAIRTLWIATDGPVAAGRSSSWTFGPDAWAVRWEPYAESPGGKRLVVYLDKARLEINDPSGDQSSAWFVTSGLLVCEMVLGRVQVGDREFTARAPADIPLAGDTVPRDPEAPTYASLRQHSALLAGNQLPDRSGQPIREVLRRDGTVQSDASVPAAEYAGYDPVTGHNSARPFRDWLAARAWDALYVVGRPIAEPYWVRVRVGGQPRWVLVQAFERRVLTFTPDNPPGWQIEMGNVGRHYYEWRYGTPPPVSP